MTEQNLIDHVAILEAFERVVAEVGEGHIDPNAADGEDCRYVSYSGDQPVCIAASILHNIGVTVGELKRWEGQSALSMAPGTDKATTPAGLKSAYGIVTHRAARVLSYAQSLNDLANPWGRILADTKNALPMLAGEGEA